MSYITLENVSLNYLLPEASSLKSRAISYMRGQGKVAQRFVPALSDLSLSLVAGDRVAVLGANGAGKSTLLKVIAGIYEPTSGCVRVSGKLAALTDMTLGLNFNETGRNNIYTRFLHMGYSVAVASSLEQDIVEFADIGEFIDQPLTTYSSGMLMRLAFAIVTAKSPDIIVMDEWLSVGDAQFIKKAEQRMLRLVENSSIVVLASHSLPLLDEWCNRALLLRDGRGVLFSDVAEASEHYLRMTPGC